MKNQVFVLCNEADEDGEKDFFRKGDAGSLFDASHPAANPLLVGWTHPDDGPCAFFLNTFDVM